jgi:hypothetical protein
MPLLNLIDCGVLFEVHVAQPTLAVVGGGQLPCLLWRYQSACNDLRAVRQGQSSRELSTDVRPAAFRDELVSIV